MQKKLIKFYVQNLVTEIRNKICIHVLNETGGWGYLYVELKHFSVYFKFIQVKQD